MSNESSREESNIGDDVELPITVAQALDSLQVVRKYICEQPEIPRDFFSAQLN